MANHKKVRRIKCDYPCCESMDAKRFDIKTNIFRGDDVVLFGCKEHRKPEHESVMLQTDKAKKQL